MKKLSALVSSLLLGTGLAQAADMPNVFATPPAVLWSWTGFYVGGHIGGGFGTSQFSDPAGSIYGDNVRSPQALGGVQAGFNYQIPNSNWVLGAEADISALGADGTNTCLASSGDLVSANCRVRQNASGSLTGRLGFATGNGGHTLVYGKAGIAGMQEQIDIMTNNAPVPPQATSFDGMRWGWTIGAGLEKALTPAWSIKAEYDYANFGSVNVATPQGAVMTAPVTYALTAGGTTSASQGVQTFKLGLNLKLGEDINARWEPPASDYHLRGTADAPIIPDYDIEAGGRVWYSSGSFQKDVGAGFTADGQQNMLISRLNYSTSAVTAELFGRVDTASNFFVKGFAGGGDIAAGKMHDEDWGAFEAAAYSNTVSTPTTGQLGYATFDAGYALFHGASAKVGGFIGYNYFHENKAANGCYQIANNNADCATAIPGSVTGVTEDDRWDSLRVGANAVVKVTDKLSLTGDAAYLPYVAFHGQDNHVLRDFISNETGSGQGVQLEGIVSYSLGKYLDIGAGGRYWAMWATNGYTNVFGCPCQTQPVRTERYGVFVQASVKLDGLN